VEFVFSVLSVVYYLGLLLGGILFPHINDDARSKSHQSY